MSERSVDGNFSTTNPIPRGMTTPVQPRLSTRPRRVLIGCAVVVVAALAWRVMYVHDKTWEYRLFPSSTPPKVAYDQREYQRGNEIAKVETGFARSGKTMGGGLIYAPTGYRTATVIDVADGARVVEYGLMGGP